MIYFSIILRFPSIVICEGVVISTIGILGLVNSFKNRKGLIITYYVLNILASIVATIIPFLSICYIFIFYCPDGSFCFKSSKILLPLIIPDLTNLTEKETFSSIFKFISFPLLFVNIFVKLPVTIIASIKAKAFLNSPLTKDIEMNDIANLDEIEQTTNKSQ